MWEVLRLLLQVERRGRVTPCKHSRLDVGLMLEHRRAVAVCQLLLCCKREESVFCSLKGRAVCCMHRNPTTTILMVEFENTWYSGSGGIFSSPKESICQRISSGKNKSLRGEAPAQSCNRSHLR